MVRVVGKGEWEEGGQSHLPPDLKSLLTSKTPSTLPFKTQKSKHSHPHLAYHSSLQRLDRPIRVDLMFDMILNSHRSAEQPDPVQDDLTVRVKSVTLSLWSGLSLTAGPRTTGWVAVVAFWSFSLVPNLPQSFFLIWISSTELLNHT